MNAMAPINLPACPCCGAPVDPLAVVMSQETGIVTLGGAGTHLSRAEFTIFERLVNAYPNVASKDQIYEDLYALRPDCDWPEIKTLDVLVCKMRPKLSEIGIEIGTVWGRGWQLVPPEAAASSVTKLAQTRKRRRG